MNDQLQVRKTDVQINYANFREHEIKAFWEWLESSGAKVLPLGIKGPLPGKTFAVDLDITKGEHNMYAAECSTSESKTEHYKMRTLL